jgi:hypothetical protein
VIILQERERGDPHKARWPKAPLKRWETYLAFLERVGDIQEFSVDVKVSRHMAALFEAV